MFEKMEKMLFFYLIIILLNIIISKEDIISFKIETFQYKGEYSNPTIINQLYDSNIVTTMNIGSYSYPLKAFVEAQNHYFYISTKCNIQKSFFSDYKTNFNYNRHKSYSFSNTSSFNLDFSQSNNACTANEDFEIFKANKMETTKEKLSFILTEDTNEEIPNCLRIGLLENTNKDSTFSEYNLITQLKHKNHIKFTCWSIIFNTPVNYNNDNLLVSADELLNLKGNLIIGDYPHNFDKEKFYKSQMANAYIKIESNIMKWELEFDKIYYLDNDKEIKIMGDKRAIFDPSNYFIIAPEDYFDQIITKFFQKYKNDNICNYDYLEEYTTIYCEKSSKFSINEIKQFPSLFFVHTQLGYTFEISYKDLFIENNGKYWFLLISDTEFMRDQWILGNIFMRKYQLVFNLESREISFYNPNLEKIENGEENVPKDSSKIILYVLLIIALCIILIGVGIFIKMKFYPSGIKKKRANELDDDFEYVSHKNNNNNNNDDNQLFNNSINQE